MLGLKLNHVSKRGSWIIWYLYMYIHIWTKSETNPPADDHVTITKQSTTKLYIYYGIYCTQIGYTWPQYINLSPTHDDVMMAKRYGNAFWISGTLYWESIGDRLRVDFPLKGSVMWGFDVLFNVSLAKLLNKQMSDRWDEKSWHSCDVNIVISRNQFNRPN